MSRSHCVIRLTGKDINGEDVSCLGIQLEYILNILASEATDCEWFVADIDANQALPLPLSRSQEVPQHIGDADVLAVLARQIDQFLSGIFLAVPRQHHLPHWSRFFSTEDKPYEEMDPAIYEIRAFDTTYFEIYAVGPEPLMNIAHHFNVEVHCQ